MGNFQVVVKIYSFIKSFIYSHNKYLLNTFVCHHCVSWMLRIQICTTSICSTSFWNVHGNEMRFLETKWEYICQVSIMNFKLILCCYLQFTWPLSTWFIVAVIELKNICLAINFELRLQHYISLCLYNGYSKLWRSLLQSWFYCLLISFLVDQIT